MKGLVGGVADDSVEERRQWAESLFPRSCLPGAAHPSEEERTSARSKAWGNGDAQAAKAAMCDVGPQKKGFASLPHVRLMPMSAPGPTGDRQEHLDAVVDNAGAGQRRRLFRAIDELTVKSAIGDIPDCCRWLLNTQSLFLRKDRELKCKYFNDEDWIEHQPLASEEHIGPLFDVPESATVNVPD